MKVIVFDDFFSIIHFIAGAVTLVFGLWLFIVFVVFELMELMMKSEKLANYIGDYMEYMLGVAVYSLIFIS